MTNEELIKLVRKTTTDEIARQILSVQPMPDVDWEALAQHPFWHSFVDRHIRKKDDDDQGT